MHNNLYEVLYATDLLPDPRMFYAVGVYFGIFFGFVLVCVWIGQTIEHICKVKCTYDNMKISDSNMRVSVVLAEYAPIKRVIRWILILIIGVVIAITLTLFCLNKLSVI